VEIKGAIRRGPSGPEVSFPFENKWHRLQHGPLFAIIRQFYEFILSKDYHRNIGGKTYNIRMSGTSGSRSVEFDTTLGFVRLTRFENGVQGGANPSDRVQVRLIIPTEETGGMSAGHDDGTYDTQGEE
jgi:hypothetical protein